MAEERIVITIDEEGNLTAQTNGFKGSICEKALEDILEDTIQVKQANKTDEYYQQATMVQQQIIKRRQS